jgi:deoxyadenosine/deoxycytidine kinase
MKPRYIAMAGNIGCGKSTLVDFVCKQYGIQPFFEPNANNPYLKDFYGDMRTWAFHSQIYFLTHKFRIHQQLQKECRDGVVVQDRTIWEDAEIFAYNLYRRHVMPAREYRLYRELYDAIAATLAPPDLLIYLRANVRTLRKRIAMRARPEEQSIPVSYLRALNHLYEDWVAHWTRGELLVVETDNLDYITDLVDRMDLLQTIAKHVLHE